MKGTKIKHDIEMDEGSKINLRIKLELRLKNFNHPRGPTNHKF
jgi:hypothetical protein